MLQSLLHFADNYYVALLTLEYGKLTMFGQLVEK